MQGVSHKGHVSKPPVPEKRKANRLHGEAVKKKKDAAKDAATRKRERKERHARECKIAEAEGAPRPATPESTEEEDSSDVELNFSNDDEAATGAGSPLVYQGAGGEGSTVTLGKATFAPGSLVDPPPARAEQRSPTPVAGQRLPASTADRRSSTPVTGQRSPPPATVRRTPAPAVSTGGRGSAASAEMPVQTTSRRQADLRAVPLGQFSGGVNVPRARRSSTGKRSMSARSE